MPTYTFVLIQGKATSYAIVTIVQYAIIPRSHYFTSVPFTFDQRGLRVRVELVQVEVAIERRRRVVIHFAEMSAEFGITIIRSARLRATWRRERRSPVLFQRVIIVNSGEKNLRN